MAKKGLGRGLGALIPNVNVQELDKEDGLQELSLAYIDANPDQPRKHFNQEAIQELVQSIQEFGVVQPVVVRRKGDRYELVAGERRFRAAREAGLNSIRALVREVSDQEALQIGLIENLQREDLNAIEEAEAYRKLISEYQITQADLARHLGKSRSAIANTLRLLSLPQEIQQAIIDGFLTSGHARTLLALPDAESQAELARRIQEEKLSVREVEQMVQVVSPKRQKAPSKHEAPRALHDVAKELTTHLQLPVTVGVSGRKGYVRLTFASAEEFSRIVEVLKNAAGSAMEKEA